MNLKTKQFKTWIDTPRGARFEIRELPPSKEREIVSISNGNGTAWVILSYAYQFTSWQGVHDEEGNELPFSKENLALAIENDLQSLTEAMLLFREKRDEHYQKIREAEKN